MKILIAIDDSECSSKAVESVTSRNWGNDTEFRLITVMEPVYDQYALAGSYVEPMLRAQEDYGNHCRELIEAQIAQLKKALPNNKTSSEIIEGVVVSSIVDEAKKWDADLLIVGSHGRRGFQKFLLGSVAEKLASLSPCSLEIVKQKSKEREKTEEARATHEAAAT